MNETVLYGCELTARSFEPNCQAFATRPEQSAPYLPECEHEGQLPVQPRTKTIASVVVVALVGLVALLAHRFASRADDGKTAGGASSSRASSNGGARITSPSASETAVDANADEAPVALPDAAVDAGARVLFAASWGSGIGKLGRDRPAEGNPEGPMSLALAGRDVLVLDQVNGRLARYDADGRLKGTSDAPTTAQDLAVGKDGTVAMIDRLVGKTVTLVDANGRKIGELPLGARIAEPGLVTGVVIDGTNVYAEREHGALVLLGSTDGTPTGESTQLAGRPSRDGTLLLTAGISSKGAGRAYLNAMDRRTTTSRFAVQVSFPRPAQAIVLLDSDVKGKIYLGVAAGDPGDAVVACLDPGDGRVLGKVTLPLSHTPEESFRDFSVGDDGAIVFAVRGEDGVTYRSATCP